MDELVNELFAHIVERKYDSTVKVSKRNRNSSGIIDEETLNDPGLTIQEKIALQIYKFNMTKKPACYRSLVEIFDGTVSNKTLTGYLSELSYTGVIELASKTKKGRPYTTIRYYFISDEHMERVRKLYEENVKPRESPDDTVSYTPNIILDSERSFKRTLRSLS